MLSSSGSLSYDGTVVVVGDTEKPLNEVDEVIDIFSEFGDEEEVVVDMEAQLNDMEQQLNDPMTNQLTAELRGEAVTTGQDKHLAHMQPMVSDSDSLVSGCG